MDISGQTPPVAAPRARPAPARRPGVILAVATVGFVVNFWDWALLSPLGPDLKQSLGLSSFQQALVVAVPVIVGSLGRIPVGALTDRYGGRIMFPAISCAAVVPMLFLGLVGTRSLAGLLVGGFFLGIAGTVFAVGIPLVSAWYPPQRRGLRARRVRRRHGWHRDQRADHGAARRRGQHPDAVHADRRRPGRLRVRRLGGAPGRRRPHPADRAARPPARLDRAAADHPASVGPVRHRVRRLRRVLGLPADVPEDRVRADADRRGQPDGRVRARRGGAAAGRRLAVRPARRGSRCWPRRWASSPPARPSPRPPRD